MLICNQSYSFIKNIPILIHKYTMAMPKNTFNTIANIEIPDAVTERPNVPRTIPFATSKKKFESLSACLEFILTNINKL